MAISEDLQRRIQNLTGDMGIVGGGAAALSAAGKMAKGAISNREMELLQQASPEASPTSSNVDIAKAIDALMQQLQSSKERLL